MGELTHLDKSGHARMVDVGDKPVTAREAVAEGRVRMDVRDPAKGAVGRCQERQRHARRPNLPASWRRREPPN